MVPLCPQLIINFNTTLQVVQNMATNINWVHLYITLMNQLQYLFLVPKFSIDSEVLVHTHSPPHRAKIFGIPSYNHPDNNTVLFQDGSIAEYSDTTIIFEVIPVTLTKSLVTYFPAGFRRVLMLPYFWPI